MDKPPFPFCPYCGTWHADGEHIPELNPLYWSPWIGRRDEAGRKGFAWGFALGAILASFFWGMV